MTNDTTTKKRDLRPVEVGVGAGAAVITAFASSYLGTAGTLTGAALASVVGTVSTSVLRNSADRSAEKLRRTTVRLRETGRVGPELGGRSAGTATAATSADRPTGAQGDPDGSPAAGIGGRTGRPKWLAVAAGAVVAFAVAMVAITGIESAAGTPLAGLVGNQTGGGTTIGRVTGTNSGSPQDESPTPTPTPTPTVTPTGGPADTSTATTPSAESTPTGESSPTGEPTTPAATTAPPSVTDPVPSATVPAPTPTTP